MLSPGCNSDCARCWASPGFIVASCLGTSDTQSLGAAQAPRTHCICKLHVFLPKQLINVCERRQPSLAAIKELAWKLDGQAYKRGGPKDAGCIRPARVPKENQLLA